MASLPLREAVTRWQLAMLTKDFYILVMIETKNGKASQIEKLPHQTLTPPHTLRLDEKISVP